MEARVDIILSSPHPDVSIPEQTFPQFLLGMMKTHVNKTAIVDAESGESLSYHDVCVTVDRLIKGFNHAAHSLRSEEHQHFPGMPPAKAGCLRGRVVLIVSRNHLLYGPVFLALASLGAITSTVNPASTIGELKLQIEDSRPIWIITGNEQAQLVLESIEGSSVRKIMCFAEAEECIPLSDLMTEVAMTEFKEVKQFHPANALDIIYLPYSSGTTGKPKGVMHSHRSLIAEMLILTHPSVSLEVDPGEERYVLFHPMFHAFGLAIMFPSIMASGSTLILMERFSMDNYLKSLEKYKATVLPLAPPVVVLLAKHPDVDLYDLSSCKTAFCASAPLSAAVSERVTKRLKLTSFRQGYGMTECDINVVSPVNEWKHGSTGRVCVNTQVKVVDPQTGQSLAPNKPGEIWIRSSSMMSGYFRRPAATAATLTKEGWLMSGDIGYYDENENLYIVDRLKELIKYKGHQVAPAELESILLKHPDVADAAVVGLPDEFAGELPTAFIVKKLDHEVRQDEIEIYIQGLLSPEKWLRGGVRFVDVIPKSPSGKILRRLLKGTLKATPQCRL